MTRPENFETALHLMALFLHFRKHTRFVIEQHIARLKAESCCAMPNPDYSRKIRE
jgi:hypothetical protein